PLSITHLKAPDALREASAAEGLSPGKMAVYLLAREQGIGIELETLRESSIHAAAAELGGVQKIVGPSAQTDGGKAAIAEALGKMEQQDADKPNKLDK